MNIRCSMTFLGASALILHAATARAQITGLTLNPNPVEACALETITVTGTGQCGEFTVDLGDGLIVYVPPPCRAPPCPGPSHFPHEIVHVYGRPGTYTPVAQGRGNCSGTASATLQVVGPHVTSIWPFSVIKPDGGVIIEGQNFGSLPGKLLMHYTAFTGQQHDVEMQNLQWGDNFAAGQIPHITGVLDQAVTFTVEARCGVQSHPWPARFTARRDFQRLPWQRISCSMSVGPGSGDLCQNQGGNNFPVECFISNFPTWGLALTTGFEGYHASGWGGGGSGFDTFVAFLNNGWVLDSVTPLRWAHFGRGSGNATEQPLWSTDSIPQEGVRWRIDSCTAYSYWADIFVTGPIDVPY